MAWNDVLINVEPESCAALKPDIRRKPLICQRGGCGRLRWAPTPTRESFLNPHSPSNPSRSNAGVSCTGRSVHVPWDQPREEGCSRSFPRPSWAAWYGGSARTKSLFPSPSESNSACFRKVVGKKLEHFFECPERSITILPEVSKLAPLSTDLVVEVNPTIEECDLLSGSCNAWVVRTPPYCNTACSNALDTM